MDRSSVWDKEAQHYDEKFHSSLISLLMRKRNIQLFETYFARKGHLLELGCGTGDEAIWLARRGHRITALDISSEMIETAKRKAQDAGLSEFITFRVLPIENLSQIEGNGVFDGFISSFGPLSCVLNLEKVTWELDRLIKPNSYAVISVLNKICLYELFYYLKKGRLRKTVRRFNYSPVGVKIVDNEPLVPCNFYTKGELIRKFPGTFSCVECFTYPIVLPPSFLPISSGTLRRRMDLKLKMERAASEVPFLRSMGDHLFLVLRKA